jgi:hypothetical protein
MNQTQRIPLIIFVFIVATLFEGCQSPENQKQKDSISKEDLTKTLVPADTLRIPITFPSLVHTYDLRLLNLEGDSVLARRNNRTNSIEFFDLNKKKMIDNWQYNMDGPHGVDDLSGFYILNRDTVFIVSHYRTWLKIGNAEGKIYKTIDLQKDQNGNSISQYRVETRVGNRTPIIQHKDVLFIPVDEVDATDFEVDDTPFIYYSKYKIGKDYAEPIKFQYPKVYRGKTWVSWLFINSSIYNENTEKIVVSFALSHDLHTYDPEKDTMICHPNGYLDGEFEEYPYGTPDKIWRYMSGMGYYSQVLYDKFRDVYYRLYLGPIPEEERHRKDLRVMHYSPPTMYIYDNNFRIIGETRLPENSHFLYDYFVAEEGLYFNNYHPSKEDVDENEIAYTLYKLENLADEK